MDYTITPAPRRSLLRRLAPWTASLALFAGGGYGVYRYAAPASADAAATTSTATAETPNDRLLAAMPAGGATATGGYTTPFDAPASRYATPTLPAVQEDEEVTTPRDAAAVEAPANPFATIPTGGFGDRYATSATPYGAATAPAAVTTTPSSESAADATEEEAPKTTTTTAPAETAADESDSDVARGQEPSGANPLRSAARSPVTTTTASEADEARAAFGGETTAQPSLTMPSRVGAASTGAAGADETTSASEVAIGGSRYAAPQPLQSAAAAPLADDSQEQTPQTISNPYAAAPFAAATAAPAYLATATPPQTQTTPTANPLYPTYTEQTAGSDSITPTPGIATTDGTGRPGERILEGLQTPTLTVQKLAPPEIQVGRKCTFAIRVQNNSQRTAHNVLVSDTVPLGTQLVGTAPKANVSGAQIVWDLGTLSVGEERIVEMELMPTEEGELGSVATVTFATQASAKTRCTRPQLALRLSSEPRVMIGELHLVQIEVTNPGTGDATGVMLLESIPQGVSHEGGPALEYEVGTLHPGETKKIDLMLHAEEAGLIDNIMTARADANLQVQANCQFEVIAPALKVTVEGPARRVLERPATYTVNVDNPGTASAREVQLITQLPKGLQFVSANNMGEYDAATHSVYWSLAELPANQRGTVELTALAVEAGDQTLQFATRAQQGLEDRTETHVMVEGIVALNFDVQDTEDAIAVGEETSYEVRVTNEGTKTATNVQVVAAVPPGLRAQPGQGDARYTIQGDRVIFAPLAQLAPKAEAAFRFRVQSVRAGDQRVTLQVTTDEVREPIVGVESTQVYSDE